MPAPFITYLFSFFLLCLFPFFFVGGPGYHDPRSWVAFWNIGHVAFFCVGSYLLCLFVRKRKPDLSFPVVLSLVFVVVLIFGSTVECIQTGISGRFPEGEDILRNQLGCLVAFAFLCPYKWQTAPRWLTRFRVLVVLLLGIAFIPLATALLDETIASRQFPLLSGFETYLEKYRWKTEKEILSREDTIVKEGKHALKVQLTTDQYSGISLFYFARNWQGYKTLSMAFYNPDSEPLILHCRIHDRLHDNSYSDRFYTRFTLKNGWNQLNIPLVDVLHAPESRDMDMEHIENMRLFVTSEPRERVMYIDQVLLKR